MNALTPLNQNQSCISFCANGTSDSLITSDPWCRLHSHSETLRQLPQPVSQPRFVGSGDRKISPLTHGHGYSLDISIAWNEPQFQFHLRCKNTNQQGESITADTPYSDQRHYEM